MVLLLLNIEIRELLLKVNVKVLKNVKTCKKNLPLYTSLIETEVHLLYFNFLNTITYFAASSPDHCGPRSLHSSVQGGGFLVAAWAHLLALGGRVDQDLLVGAGHRGDVPGLGAGRGQAEAAVLPPPRLQVPHHPPVADAEIEAGEARAQPEYHQQRTCDRTTQYDDM